jgi:tetratricopeptide (TPR) repeat protein
MKINFRLPFLGAMLASLTLASAALTGCAPGKPSNADLDAYIKARDLYLRGAVDQAALLVSRISCRTSGFHQARLLEGKILYFKGDLKSSESIFRELIRRISGYTEAQLWLLRSLQAQGRTREAENLLDSILELNPGDPRFLHQAGMLRLAGDDVGGALAFFRRSQEYGVDLSQSYVESARILYRFGMTDPALDDLATAKALLPADSAMRKPVENLERRIRETRK